MFCLLRAGFAVALHRIVRSISIVNEMLGASADNVAIRLQIEFNLHRLAAANRAPFRFDYSTDTIVNPVFIDCEGLYISMYIYTHREREDYYC